MIAQDTERKRKSTGQEGAKASTGTRRKTRENFHEETEFPADPPQGIQEGKHAEAASVHKASCRQAWGLADSRLPRLFAVFEW